MYGCSQFCTDILVHLTGIFLENSIGGGGQIGIS